MAVASDISVRTGSGTPVVASLRPNRIDRLKHEARVTIDALGPAEWASLFAFSASAAAIGTAYSKVAGAARLGRSIADYTRRGAAAIHERGLAESAACAPRSFLTATAIQRTRAELFFRRLTYLGARQRRDAMFDVLIAGAVAYVAAGGPDLEGGLPDLDLILRCGRPPKPVLPHDPARPYGRGVPALLRRSRLASA